MPAGSLLAFRPVGTEKRRRHAVIEASWGNHGSAYSVAWAQTAADRMGTWVSMRKEAPLF
jgi:threonine dehydratase